ncbi:MAG: SHOCT-like domain-containing protein [Planctomycetota bacterium]
MGDNNRRVLNMLAEGKINAEEAARLLERLSPTEDAALTAAPAEAEADAAPESQSGNKPKYLRVVVNSNNGDKVNVRVPLALIKAGIRLQALMPKEAKAELEKKGFDLDAETFAGMDMDELVEAFSDLRVDVDSSDGDEVRIYCE